MISGGVDTGWTFYTPYSTQSSHYDVVPTMIGVVIAGFSSLLTGLNFVVTTHWMRAPGLTWCRLPIFVWTLYATSIIFLLAMPVLAMNLILVIVERVTHIGIFDPRLGRRSAVVSALVLVLLASGGVHHDFAGHGNRERNYPLLCPQEFIRLHLRAVFQLGQSPGWVFWFGRITCLWPEYRCTRRWCFPV